LFTAFLLLAYNLIYADANIENDILDHKEDFVIFIPEQYGKIEQSMGEGVRSTGEGKMVILIKDAHCNYEAQKNIEKILEVLIKEYKIDLVCVEGAEGNIDTSIFQSMPDKKIREYASSIYVKKGLLSAAEALSISKARDLPFILWGDEDAELYIKNLELFRSAIKKQDEIKYKLEVIQGILNIIKQKVYSQQLKEFDAKLTEYENNALSLMDWIKYLSNHTKALQQLLKDKKNIRLVLQCMVLEDLIDAKTVEKERAGFIKYLYKKLPKEQFNVLLKNSLSFKAGKISPLNFYSFLRKQMVFLPSSCFSSLRKYICLLEIHSMVDETLLFRELKDVNECAIAYLKVSEEEKNIYIVDKKVSILRKLLNVAMNKKEAEYYILHKNELSINEINALLVQESQKHGVKVPACIQSKEFSKGLQDAAVLAEEFYRGAIERDSVFLKNVLKKMKHEKKNKAIVVSGGFHADGIREKLREQEITCVEIIPVINKYNQESPYLRLMANETLKFKSFLPQYIALPLSCWLAGFGDTRHVQGIASLMIQSSNLPVRALRSTVMRQDPENAGKFEELVRLAGVKDEEQSGTVRDDALYRIRRLKWIKDAGTHELANILMRFAIVTVIDTSILKVVPGLSSERYAGIRQKIEGGYFDEFYEKLRIAFAKTRSIAVESYSTEKEARQVMESVLMPLLDMFIEFQSVIDFISLVFEEDKNSAHDAKYLRLEKIICHDLGASIYEARGIIEEMIKGQIERKKTMVNVKEVIRNEFERKAKNMSVIYEGFNAEIPEVFLNERHLRQVVKNLIINAAEAGASALKAAISYDVERQEIVLLITDNGVGIPPENKERIFEPYFTTKKDKKGHGIGLSLCREMVELSNGRIWVFESSIGKGTTFKITYPVHKDELKNVGLGNGEDLSERIDLPAVVPFGKEDSNALKMEDCINIST
jgi:hypothetical protein